MSNNPHEPNPQAPQSQDNQPAETNTNQIYGQDYPISIAQPQAQTASQTSREYSQQTNNTAYSTPQENGATYGVAIPQQTGGKKPKNIVGIVGLALSALGFVLSLFSPWVAIAGRILLFVGLTLGIIGLFQKNREKLNSIVAICIASGGLVVSVLMSVFASPTEPNNQVLEDGTIVYPVYSATLEARANGEATLFYTDINGNRQEVEFADYISVETQVDTNATAAMVLNGVHATGMPSCSFIEPEGYDFIRLDNQDSESTFDSYTCAIVVREEK